MAGESRFEVLLANLNDPELSIRLAAIEALGERRDQRAVKPLLVAFVRRSPIEKDAIMRAFRVLGVAVFAPLNMLLLRDVNAILRAGAAGVLGELGNADSIRPLSRAAQENNEMVRALAVIALSKFRQNDVYAPLLRALRDESLSVRLEAAIALGKRGDVRAVELLIQAVEDQLVFPENLPVILKALGHTGDPRAVEVLADALEMDSPSIRAAAVEALGNIDDIRTGPVLQSALADRAEMVRDAAANVLRRLRDVHGGE